MSKMHPSSSTSPSPPPIVALHHPSPSIP
ncbi:hypothetical protein A2U01_0070728, partial [Trifolium medium]|nr:hypothetical protein [Trifolium medium]